MTEARRRGVLFDVGHGGGSFLWPVATRAVAQGFVPDTISTDLHNGSINIQQSDMPNVMSKMMLLGMSLAEVLVRSTVNPAKADRPVSGAGDAGRRTGRRISPCSRSRAASLRSRIPGRPSAWGRSGWNACSRSGTASLLMREAPPQPVTAEATIYDLLLKRVRIGGHKEALDIAITGNRIAHIRPGLNAAQSRVVAEAEGYEAAPANLSEGMTADLTLLKAGRMVLTIRNGKVITDDDGLTIPDVSRAGPYSNFK